MRALALCLLLVAAPAAAQDIPERMLFPTPYHQKLVDDVVQLRLSLALCPRIKAGPRAKEAFRIALAMYDRTPPDVPALKAYIDREFAKELRGNRLSAQTWCDRAVSRYGEFGRKVRNAVVMRDGSPALRDCVLQEGCEHPIEIHVY